jgi:mannosyltransferase OCH1-like enzyme
MSWHLKVPKILHVYWGGQVLPYIRFMTVKTFMQLNPDWKIMLWLPKTQDSTINWKTKELKYKADCKDYFQELLNLPIERNYVDFDEYGFTDVVSEVHKSDFLRYCKLYEIGGVWSDMDIVYFKSITALEVNNQYNRNKETFVCIGRYGHSNGFLMSARKSKFFDVMIDLSFKEYDKENYQGIGTHMFNKYYRKQTLIEKISSVANIGMGAVYSHDANHIHELLDGSLPRFNDRAIGVHWYAAHPIWEDFLKETNGGLINLGDNIIGNILSYGLDNRR